MIEIKIPLSQLRKQLIGADHNLEDAVEMLKQNVFPDCDVAVTFEVQNVIVAEALKRQLSSIPSGPMRREILKQLGFRGDEYAPQNVAA